MPHRRALRMLAPFQYAAYRRLSLALVLHTFATGSWTVGLVWEVIRSGGGPGRLSAAATASSVGLLSMALFGGVIADRFRSKHILQLVALVQVTGYGAIGVLSLADRTQWWHLVLVALCIGVGLAFYYPAYSSWLPSLVASKDLVAVNGFEGVVRRTVNAAIGPALAGAVVGAANPGTSILMSAGAAALGLVVLSTIRLTPPRHAHEGKTTIRQDLMEGFTYLRHTRWLLTTVLFASITVLALLGPLEVLVPFLVKDRLGGGPHEHAIALAAFGIGGAIGALVTGSMPLPRRYLTRIIVLWGPGALPFAVIGVADSLWVVVACMFVTGYTFAAPEVIWGTLLQRRVPPHLLGRVSSLDWFISLSLMPVSMAIAGPVSDLIGLRTTFLLAGVLPCIAGVLAIWLPRLDRDEIAHPLEDEPRVGAPEPA